MIRLSKAGFTAAVAAASVVASSLPGAADTLHGAVRRALETNPELYAIRHNRNAIDEELRAARGLRLPTVDLQAEWGHRRYKSKTPLVTNNYPNHAQKELQVIVGQRLFDGWEAIYEIERQKARVSSARFRVADTSNAIALRAVQAYLEVLRSRAVLASADRNVRALGRLRSRVNRRVSAGQGNRAEQSEAGSRYEGAIAVRAEAQARLRDAVALFVAVIGRRPGHLHGAPTARNLPRSLSGAIAIAKFEAPSVRATDNDHSAARAAIGGARSRFYPKITGEARARWGYDLKESGDHERDYRAMVIAKWNLFNGGIDSARLRESRHRASEAAEVAANTRRLVIRETRVSWNALHAARTRLPSLRRQLSLARQTRAAYNEQYDAGARRLLDLLDAQSEVFVADAALRTEELAAKFSGYRLLAAMGTLIQRMGLEAPEEGVRPPTHSRLDGWHYRIHHRSEAHPAPSK
ncbi:MAG: TolC family outer membrane protein [Pseudomonadota bacterium]